MLLSFTAATAVTGLAMLLLGMTRTANYVRFVP